MVRCAFRTIGWGTALAAQCAWAQATLPTDYCGPWQYAVPPPGWTFYGLGLDPDPGYDGTNTAAKLDDAGDYVSIHYAGAAGAVSFWIKGLTFVSGGVFRVEQSTDGADWSALAVATNLPAVAERRTLYPSPAARHLRFLYAERVTGNVGLDGIAVAPFVVPEIGAIVRTGSVFVVAVPETMPGRTYQLEVAEALTNAPVVWTPVAAAGGSTNVFVFTNVPPTNAPKRYYRVGDATP